MQQLKIPCAAIKTQSSQINKNKYFFFNFVFFFFFFFYFGLCWVFVAARAFFLVLASRGYSLVMVLRLLIGVASLAAEHML